MKSIKLFVMLTFVIIYSSAHAATLYTAEFSLNEENTSLTGSGYLTFNNDTVFFGQVRADDVFAIFASIDGANHIVDDSSLLTNTEFLGWSVDDLLFTSYTNFQANSLGWFNYGGASSLSISGVSNKVWINVTNVYEGEFSSSSSVPEPSTLLLMSLCIGWFAVSYLNQFNRNTAKQLSINTTSS